MRIAVAHSDGQVFGHFGKAPEFKFYVVEDGKVVTSDVFETMGNGHDEVATFLSSVGIDVVICGGLGEGAQTALDKAGIKVVSGVEGSADEAVEAFINGEIESEGVNCNCGGDCGEGCGGGCGGCGGGCGGCGGGQMQILYEGPNAGKLCTVNYEGTFNDGEVFDSSFERGEPIQFVCGVGMMIPGFDKAVVDMNVGDTVNIHLSADEAYGEVNPNMVMEMPISKLPGSEDLNVGDEVMLGDMYGRQFPVKVTAKTEDTITLDANHEMAGKELNFKIELVAVSEV